MTSPPTRRSPRSSHNWPALVIDRPGGAYVESERRWRLGTGGVTAGSDGAGPVPVQPVGPPTGTEGAARLPSPNRIPGSAGDRPKARETSIARVFESEQ